MTVKDLVKKYHSNRKTYLKASYNETQLRTDFLDPFLNYWVGILKTLKENQLMNVKFY